MGISPYLAELRTRIGHDLLLMPSAAVAVFDGASRVLLARHVYDGRWGLPGGAIDPGEAPAAAAQRELQEEVGLRVENLHLIGAYGGHDFYVRYDNGDEVAYVAVLYGSRNATGTVALQADEIREIGWFTSEQAMSLDLWPTMKVMVPEALRWLKQGVARPM